MRTDLRCWRGSPPLRDAGDSPLRPSVGRIARLWHAAWKTVCGGSPYRPPPDFDPHVASNADLEAGITTLAAHLHAAESRLVEPIGKFDALAEETGERIPYDAAVVTQHVEGDGQVVDVGRKRRTAPPALWRAIYTTNAIESLNSTVRRAIRTRGHFPNDRAARKLIYLALRSVVEQWKRPPAYWSRARSEFSIRFGERFKVVSA